LYFYKFYLNRKNCFDNVGVNGRARGLKEIIGDGVDWMVLAQDTD
jgi:hypothetical protein